MGGKGEQPTAPCTGMWLKVSSQAWDKKASPEPSLSFPSVHFQTNERKVTHALGLTDSKELTSGGVSRSRPSTTSQRHLVFHEK